MGTSTTPTAAKPRSLWPWLVGGAVALALVVAIVAVGGGGDADAIADDPTDYTVKRETMVVSVSQPGQIEARNKEIIKSKVRRDVEVVWLVEEGADVQAGDVLVRLERTELEDTRESDEQNLESARSSLFAAQVSEQNTISQANSNIEKAELDFEFAKLALRKYIEGEYPQEIKQAEGAVKLQRDTLLRARDKMDWSQRLYKEGYITQSEADADAAAYDKAQLDLEVAEGQLQVLKEYTHYEQKRKLESDVEQKEAELERVKNKGKADIEKAKVDVATADSKVKRLERALADTVEDLANCDILAPVNGRVVYAPQGSRWRRDEPISLGVNVRRGQEIIHLPESGAMSVALKIDEAQRDKLEVGMPVLITGPNLPEDGLRGELVRIAEYLDPSGWWNNYLKVYSATVDVVGDAPMLRTGMNCQTEIVVARYEDVITAPLQAVTKVGDEHVVYLSGSTRRVPIEIGLDNGRKVHVLSGLTGGERIMLDPPLEPATRNEKNLLPDVPATEPEAARPAGDASQASQPRQPAAKAPAPGAGGGRSGAVAMLKRVRDHAVWNDLDAATKQVVEQAIRDADAGKTPAIDPATQKKIQQAFRKHYADQAGGDS